MADELKMRDKKKTFLNKKIIYWNNNNKEHNLESDLELPSRLIVQKLQLVVVLSTNHASALIP